VQKVGDAYPIYDGDTIIGAIEFTLFYYDQNHIREIERHQDNVFYRSNNTKYTVDTIITGDEKMKRIKAEIEDIAISDSNVFIYGKTGTGKELVAQSIHNSSRRYMKKFISQNCGAIPSNLLESILFGTTRGAFTGAVDSPGLFELAHGGTIFLDEINSLDINLQIKLLRAIESKRIRRIGSEEEKKLDFRVIAATNEEPFLLLQQGKMKPDLFYRLAIIYFQLPDLVDRGGDIEILTKYFIDYFNSKMNRTMEYPEDGVMKVFCRYDWPGNIRELRNVIEGAFTFAEENRIRLSDIPEYIQKSHGVKEKGRGKQKLAVNVETDLIEKEIVLGIYEEMGRSLGAAAEALGLSKSALWHKLHKYESETI
jgi:arginine utilization regulatory protein